MWAFSRQWKSTVTTENPNDLMNRHNYSISIGLKNHFDTSGVLRLAPRLALSLSKGYRSVATQPALRQAQGKAQVEGLPKGYRSVATQPALRQAQGKAQGEAQRTTR
jgi:hypothetical protein